MKRLALFCLFIQLELSLALVIRAVPGASVVLPCLPFQNDFFEKFVTWKHNGENIDDPQVTTNFSGSREVSKKGFYLTISSITAANAGVYECAIKDNNMEWRRTYIVEVDVASGYAVMVYEGSTINLPCYRPPSSQADTYALWFKETSTDEKIQLKPAEIQTTGDRLEWLFSDPTDNDQTVTLREVNLEDSGTYRCESAEGNRFNTIDLIVEAVPIRAPYSCSGFTEAWEPCVDEDSRSWAAMLEESIADFSMKLYPHLSQLRSSKNLIYSPVSVSTLLSYLLLGARGDTRRTMETALSLPHDFHCVHIQMKKLKERLSDSMQMASQIYYNSAMNLSQSFTNQSVEFYEAEPVKLLDSTEDNTRVINSWVANHTNNKITQLVDSVPDDIQLILLNAVYFKGLWKTKFEPLNKEALFTKQNGDLVNVPVLHSSNYVLTVQYVPELKAKVAKFPLTGGNSLYILLPRSHKPDDLLLVEGQMTDVTIRQMIAEMDAVLPISLEVTLPRITLDVEANMNTALRKLGLSSLFEKPNLCGLCADQEVLLSDARHRAFLSLSEEGVEAGAVSALSFSRSHNAFFALRPFVLLLWSEQANVPLFIGRVIEP